MDPQLLLAQLSRIEDRQDAMTTTLVEQVRILAEQQQILRDHVRRSDANERSQKTLESFVEKATEKLDGRVRQLEDERTAKRLVVKWIIGLGGVAGAATAIVKLVLPYLETLK